MSETALSVESQRVRRICDQIIARGWSVLDAEWLADFYDALRAQLAAQQAEGERLRAALEDVVAESEQGEFIRAWNVAELALLSGGAEEAGDGK